MSRPTLKRIHVNQHVIKANRLKGENNPPLTIKHKGKTYAAREVNIDGPSKLVYRPDKPLDCGARLWIETTETVILDASEKDNMRALL